MGLSIKWGGLGYLIELLGRVVRHLISISIGLGWVRGGVGPIRRSLSVCTLTH